MGILGGISQHLHGETYSKETALEWKERVYLASYPRSGNHWMRNLIEEATHIATSSVYRDPDPLHLPDIFPWGGYCCDHGYEGSSRYPVNGEPVVVKTHYPASGKTEFDQLPYKIVICIIRHPLDAIYSHHVWVSKQMNWPITYNVPRDVLSDFIRRWCSFHNYWDNADNVLTVYYEDLYQEPEHSLKIVLDAIGYTYTDDDIARAVEKYPPTGSIFKYMDHYGTKDLKHVKAQLKPLLEKHGYRLKR
jgi:hypothetical protein